VADPLQLILEAVTDGFDKSLKSSEGSVKSFERTTTESMGGVKAAIEGLEGTTKEFSHLFGELAEAFAGGEIIEFLKGFVEAAEDDQRALEGLQDALANSKNASQGSAEGMEAFGKALAHQSGNTIPAVISAMQKFVSMGATQDQAQKLTAISADVAAARHMSLSAAAQGLARAIQSGSVPALARLGLTYADVNMKTASMTQAIDALGEKYRGFASKVADNTLEGQFSRLTGDLDALKAAFGAPLLEPLTQLVKNLDNFVLTAERLSPQAKILIDAVVGISGAFLALIAILPLAARAGTIVVDSFVNVGKAFGAITGLGRSAGAGATEAAAGVERTGAFAEAATAGVNALAAAIERLNITMGGTAAASAEAAAGEAAVGTAAMDAGEAVAAGAEIAEASNPIGWIILLVTAVIAAVVAIVTHWDACVKAFQAASRGIASVCAYIVDLFHGLMGDVGKIIDGLFLMFQGIPNACSIMGKELSVVLGAVVGFFREAFAGIIAMAQEQIRGFQVFASDLSSIWNGIVTNVSAFARSVISILSTMVDWVVQHMPAQFRAGLSEVVGGIEDAEARIAKAAHDAGATGGKALAAGLASAKGAWNAVLDYFHKVTTLGPAPETTVDTSGSVGDLSDFDRPTKEKKTKDESGKQEKSKIDALKEALAERLELYKAHVDAVKAALDILSAKEDEVNAHVGPDGPTKAQSAQLDSLDAQKIEQTQKLRAALNAQQQEEVNGLSMLETERAKIANNPAMAAQYREISSLIRAQQKAISDLAVEAIRTNVTEAQIDKERQKRHEDEMRRKAEEKKAAEEAQRALTDAISGYAEEQYQSQTAIERANREKPLTQTGQALQAANDNVQDAQHAQMLADALVAAALAAKQKAEADLASITDAAQRKAAEQAAQAATNAYIQALTAATKAQTNLTLAQIQQQTATDANAPQNIFQNLGQAIQKSVPALNTFIDALHNSAQSGINPWTALLQELIENSKAFKDIIQIIGNIFNILGQILDAFLLPIINVLDKVLTFFANGIIAIYNLFAELVGVLGIHIEKLKYINTLLGDLGNKTEPLLDVVHDLPTLKEYASGSWGPLTSEDPQNSQQDSLFDAVQTQTNDQTSWFTRLIEIGAALLVIDWLTHGKFFADMGNFVQSILKGGQNTTASVLEVVGGVGLLTANSKGILGFIEKILGVLLIIQGLFGAFSASSGGGLLGSLLNIFKNGFGGGSNAVTNFANSIGDDPATDAGLWDAATDPSGAAAAGTAGAADSAAGFGDSIGLDSATDDEMTDAVTDASSAASGASGLGQWLSKTGALNTLAVGLAGDEFGQFLAKMLGENSGNAQIGGAALGTAGGIVGTIFGGPVGGMIGAGLGGLIGNLVGGLFGPHWGNDPDIDYPDRSADAATFGQVTADLKGSSGVSGTNYTENSTMNQDLGGEDMIQFMKIQLSKGMKSFMKDTGLTAADYQTDLGLFGADATGGNGASDLQYGTHIGQEKVAGGDGQWSDWMTLGKAAYAAVNGFTSKLTAANAATTGTGTGATNGIGNGAPLIQGNNMANPTAAAMSAASTSAGGSVTDAFTTGLTVATQALSTFSNAIATGLTAATKAASPPSSSGGIGSSAMAAALLGGGAMKGTPEKGRFPGSITVNQNNAFGDVMVDDLESLNNALGRAATIAKRAYAYTSYS
jgi:hypothetical protein